jgi:uncharacterized protein (DUF169 family)
MNIPCFDEEETIGRWTGITFHHDGVPAGNCVREETRLCEAVARSFHETIVLPAEHIRCLGARRSLRLTDNDDELRLKICTEAGIALDLARKAVEEVPRLIRPAVAVTLGRQDRPDVVIGYVPPAAAMHLIRRWQETYGAGPSVKLSSFMALCGNVVAGAHTSRLPCLSFGCPDSRKYGGIEEDMLVVGLPSCLVSTLFQEKRRHANVRVRM